MPTRSGGWECVITITFEPKCQVRIYYALLKCYLVSSLEQIYGQHINMVLDSSNVWVKEITNHPAQDVNMHFITLK